MGQIKLRGAIAGSAEQMRGEVDILSFSVSET
jgi:hypothetical protein